MVTKDHIVGSLGVKDGERVFVDLACTTAKHLQPQLRVLGAKVSRKGECLTCHNPWKVLAESVDHGAVGIHRYA